MYWFDIGNRYPGKLPCLSSGTTILGAFGDPAVTAPLATPATEVVANKVTLLFATAETLLKNGKVWPLITYDIISPTLTKVLKSATPAQVIVPVWFKPEPLTDATENSSPRLNGLTSPLNSVLARNSSPPPTADDTDLTSENSKSVETPTFLPTLIPFISSGSLIWKSPFVL